MNELELLDRIAEIVDRAPKGFTVHRRVEEDDFFIVELSDGRMFTIKAEWIPLGR